jgi:hypothetical protein
VRRCEWPWQKRGPQLTDSPATQLRYITLSFETLLKDKEIIAAEVLNEYNQGVRDARHRPFHRPTNLRSSSFTHVCSPCARTLP